MFFPGCSIIHKKFILTQQAIASSVKKYATCDSCIYELLANILNALILTAKTHKHIVSIPNILDIKSNSFIQKKSMENHETDIKKSIYFSGL